MNIILTSIMGVWFSVAFSVFARTVIENDVSSWANTGGNMVSSGGSITTGNASVESSVIAEMNGSEGTVMVEATATANEKTETAQKEVSGGDISLSVRTVAESGEEGGEDATTSIIIESSVYADDVEESSGDVSEEHDASELASQSLLGTILSALKNTFAYVVSFFL